MTDPEQVLKELHARYCELTGQDNKYPVHRQSWWAFWQAGYTAEDLQTVIGYVMRHNAKGDWKYSMQIRTLIGDLEKFDDLRAEAIKQASLRKPNAAKNNILRATGRPEELPGGCKTSRESIISLSDAMRKAAG